MYPQIDADRRRYGMWGNPKGLSLHGLVSVDSGDILAALISLMLRNLMHFRCGHFDKLSGQVLSSVTKH